MEPTEDITDCVLSIAKLFIYHVVQSQFSQTSLYSYAECAFPSGQLWIHPIKHPRYMKAEVAQMMATSSPMDGCENGCQGSREMKKKERR